MADFIRLIRTRKNRFISTLRGKGPKRKQFWRLVLRVAIIGLALLIVFSIGLFAWYYKDLPKPGELVNRNASESTILYDRTGKQIYDISGDERRILLTKQEIPTTIKNATVSIEDHNFYHHHGVDFGGVIRGTLLEPFLGRGVQGGSTITQQYVKNAILSPQRSVTRKIKEIILSLELEAVYKKDDILALYLNEIPYGSNLYGAEAASQAYYGKSAKDGLTIAQAATLAAIPQAPTYYSPYGTHVDALIARKNIVIDDMVKYGYISKAEGDQAKKEAPLSAQDFAKPKENFPAPHFVMDVREQLAEKYGEDVVQRGGLRVTTTLDLDIQKKAEDAVSNVGGKLLPKVGASNAALVAIDPKTGQVLAMVGSLDYFDQKNEGNFNVATSSSRQPGSAGKPIVYATLFKQPTSKSPSTVLWDVPTNFNGYQPKNFDLAFHGPLTIRQSIGNSYNVPAVKALQLEGIPNFISTAKDLGVTTLDSCKDPGLSVALGGCSVKLTDLTAAYSVFANHGERNPMVSILKVEDSTGKVLDEWKPTPKQVIQPEIAFEVSDMLADLNAKSPTFGRLLSVLSVPGHTVAVKTGTTENYKDAWTIGYTPSIAAGVWAGNNNGKEMDHGGGSTAAAPIWQAFMASVLKGQKNESFFQPSDMQHLSVDLLSGKKPTQYSGQQVTDWFAPWQAPTQDDDVHQGVQVCKSDGTLATDATPADQVETRVYATVHSEHPDNPAWENPVQDWAKSHNLVTGPPPTTKCTITVTDPKVKISSPGNGDTVSGIFSVAADVTWPPNVSGSVIFTLDNASPVTKDSSPYTATFDATNIATGSHTITATAQGNNGHSATDSITVTIGADTTPPGPVSNVTLTATPPPGSATAAWTDPADSDLASVTFYASQSQGVQGSKIATVAATPNQVQTTKLTGLVSGVINYITIITTDKTGNNSSSTTQYTVTPL